MRRFLESWLRTGHMLKAAAVSTAQTTHAARCLSSEVVQVLAFVKDTWSPKDAAADTANGNAAGAAAEAMGAEEEEDDAAEEPVPRWAIQDVRATVPRTNCKGIACLAALRKGLEVLLGTCHDDVWHCRGWSIADPPKPWRCRAQRLYLPFQCMPVPLQGPWAVMPATKKAAKTLSALARAAKHAGRMAVVLYGLMSSSAQVLRPHTHLCIYVSRL